jgi:hypothetical protein
MTPRRAVLLAFLVFAACAEAPDAPSPEGTENPAQTPVETPPGALTVPDPRRQEPGVPGSDVPEERWEDGPGTCYAYARYVARIGVADAGGDAVAIFRREGEARALCTAPAGRAVYASEAEATFFFGLVGDFLLLDEGTGPNGRTVRVVDLTSGSVVHEATYEEPIVVEAGALLYGMEPEVVQTPAELEALGGACPEAPAWFDDGLSVGLSPQMRYDFATRTGTPTGEVLCVPIQ